MDENDVISQQLADQGYSNQEIDWIRKSGDQTFNDLFGNFFMPGEQQEKEWSQQMVSTMYQNHWNSEQEKMKRLKQAGVNPLTAAAGVANSPNSGVASSPQSAVGAANGAIGELGNLVGTASGALSDVVGAVDLLKTRKSRLDNLDADTKERLAAAGLSNVNADIAGVELKYADKNMFADLRAKWVNISKMREEIDLIKSEHDLNLQRINESVSSESVNWSQIPVNEALKLKYDAETSKINEERRYQEAMNEFYEKYHWFPNTSSLHGILAQLASSDQWDVVEKYLCTIQQYEDTVGEINYKYQTDLDNNRISQQKKSDMAVQEDKYSRESYLQHMKYDREEILQDLKYGLEKELKGLGLSGDLISTIISGVFKVIAAGLL